MSQCDRIRTIIDDNHLKQKQFALEIGISESYVSMLLKNPDINLSQHLAALIEEKYGYNIEWILHGKLPIKKYSGKNKTLSELHQKALSQLEKMNDDQVKAVLAFISSLNEVEKNFSSNTKEQSPK